jgi:tartrate-resistant acid phosphatase type 5
MGTIGRGSGTSARCYARSSGVKVHFEPYVYLAGLSHKSALVAWGGFYFKVARVSGGWRLMDDGELDNVHPPRSQTIGARSFPYGHARVEVSDEAGRVMATGETRTANHLWVSGLEADTPYRYRVLVNGHEWAGGERRDWTLGEAPDEQGLAESGRAYDNRFRTHPRPETDAPLTLAALGDFGTGVRRPSKEGRRQREVAAALEAAVEREGVRMVLTTGDNIYAGRTLLGIPLGATGDEDDDWFFTYFQPYRYVINRIPVYPCIGNHDGNETELNDDRDQIMDNFYLTERLLGEEAAGRASVGPGLFYRFRYGSQIELVCLDSSRRFLLFGERFFRHVNHGPFLQAAFPRAPSPGAPRWRIPFAHHPPYCAGPQWGNSRSSIEHLVPLYRRSGVRLVLSGHEHNFQHAHRDGIDYFVTGGGGKVRIGIPADFAEAGTVKWAPLPHFLLVRIEGARAEVTPIGDDGRPLPTVDTAGRPVDPQTIVRLL